MQADKWTSNTAQREHMYRNRHTGEHRHHTKHRQRINTGRQYAPVCAWSGDHAQPWRWREPVNVVSRNPTKYWQLKCSCKHTFTGYANSAQGFDFPIILAAKPKFKFPDVKQPRKDEKSGKNIQFISFYSLLIEIAHNFNRTRTKFQKVLDKEPLWRGIANAGTIW